MKILVKISAICALFILTISANAQMKFDVKAGLNLANQKYTYEGSSVSPDSKIGIHLGAIGEMDFSENFTFQPGLLFSMKGCKASDEKLALNYIDIPLNFLYKVDAGDMKIFGQAGPYLGYALSGKVEDEDIEFGSEDGQMKRLDYGIGIGAGVQFGNIQASLSYNFGLNNLISGGDSDNSIKNNVLGISVAYLFGE